ncbi:MAG: hypothetical protein ABF917_14135, partial [Gluconobacter oxydans]|uniref:hypothetical protein n=1 Tax=Gluconobacter oxydans TaxID=442 RepID=UPI0039E7A58F
PVCSFRKYRSPHGKQLHDSVTLPEIQTGVLRVPRTFLRSAARQSRPENLFKSYRARVHAHVQDIF